MKTGARVLFLIAAVSWAEFCYAGQVFPDVIRTAETAAPGQIFSSITGARRLDLLSFAPVVVDGKNLGALVVYDDPKTARTDDYVELYDNSGSLVAVGWYDRFGIQRIAVDSGLFDDGYVLKGTFVTLASGDSI